MCEANAAVSVDTKSAAGFANAVGVLEVVMVCSVCVKKGNFAALLSNKICSLQPYFYSTQLPLVYPSDAAAVDVGLGLCAGLVMIKREEQALCTLLYIQEQITLVLIGLEQLFIYECVSFPVQGGVLLCREQILFVRCNNLVSCAFRPKIGLKVNRHVRNRVLFL